MAQFDHRELGGAGQWMPGGMTFMAAALNPATLTDCVYLSDWRDIDLVPALIAA